MKTRSINSGFALTEVVVSAAVLMVAVTGTIAFHNYATVETYKSKSRADACMLASAIIESWQGQGGINTFNPINHLAGSIVNSGDFSISGSIVGPGVPYGFIIIWNSYPYYRIDTNGTRYRVSLAYRVIGGKKYLNVRVGWPTGQNKSYNAAKSFIDVTSSMH